MAGYSGYSMSNNAIEAYEEGMMPKSKWTKAAMLEAIKETLESSDNKELTMDAIKKLPKEAMFEQFFRYKEWHHTSSKYNVTDFYGIDDYAIEHTTDAQIEDIIKKAKTKPKESNPDDAPQGKYLCEFDYWTGSRKHPHCERVRTVGKIKGKRFYTTGYGIKNLSTKGFIIIEKVDDNEEKQ